ncbi:dienelactone hydrolase family protein [Catenuloplanes atrovinosus]|uniref:Dienelactone hydrolase n=1 Tax=Catenuloplanes atrovinosus TaxID=137266 RepID=A0AAE3YPC4_9ACTN|nr:dienelactone hydrolase family protein [Catenuloplanes atrovinosus]MDR7275829.1 dienelactone hydrolase [Catenuloplanes atrovinosus]
MTEIVLFHHVQGLTPGVRALAARFEAAGHTVHLPDLLDGRTFGTLEEGLAYAQEIGFSRIAERGRVAADALPEDVIYAGISLGAMPAQMLAQTRPGARGALLLEGCLPNGEFGAWPRSLPVQVHGREDDPIFAASGDLDAARELIGEAEHGELFLYPGSAHLFTDEGLPGYDADATVLVVERALEMIRKA